MATATGKQLAGNIRQKLEELKKVCAGLEEGSASRAPAGRWSPKEILSHLWGPEGVGQLPTMQAFPTRIPLESISRRSGLFSLRSAPG